MKLTPSSIARRLTNQMPAAVLAALCASALAAHAASGAWTGATDALWTNTPNWSASPAPDTGDTATFDGLGNGNTVIDLTGGVTISNILFDTASAAAYTIGTGAAGSQTLTNGQVNGGIVLSSTVASNQVINANLAYPVTGFYNLINNSASTLAVAGTNFATTSGSKVLNIDGTGPISITGPIVAGSGGMGLQKTNSGTLTLSGGGFFSATNVNEYLPGTTYIGVDLRAGNTIISSGIYTNVGEFTIGGVSAATNGGPGNNVNLTINGGSLGVSSWLSIGRGNGTGGVSSDLVLNNGASVYSANYSGGYNGSSTSAYNTNAPKGTVTLNNTSSLTLNGAFNHAESPSSVFTMTVNDSASVTNLSTSVKYIGDYGTGTLNINGNGSVTFGNAITYLGYRYSTGYLNLASSAIFNNSGEVRVGGSDNSGTGRNAYGVLTMNGGVANVGALTLARGNNNQNGCAGTVILNGGTLTSTNDVIVAYAGTNVGKMVINGGTLNVGTTVTKWLQFGVWDFTSAEMDLTSGNLNLNTGTSIKFNTQNSSGNHTFNQSGGSVTFYSDFATTVGGAGNVDLQQNASAATSPINTYNLDGGTLTTPQVTFWQPPAPESSTSTAAPSGRRLRARIFSISAPAAPPPTCATAARSLTAMETTSPLSRR